MQKDCIERLPSEAKQTVLTVLSGIRSLPDVVNIMIFGSYAKGTETPESDLDLAVFFNVDESSLLNCHRQLSKLCSTPYMDIQAQAFCCDELENPCGIVEEIIKYGIEY